ncbi:hypothetical protein, partial [Flavobacterium sp.]|uniref:hypothetical protein n=1 Tax=Flavobacterium sp. TaxID=239 RepID=UPI0025C47702
ASSFNSRISKAVRSPKSVVPRAFLLLLRRGKSKPRWQATNQNQGLRQRSCRKKQNERSSFLSGFESEIGSGKNINFLKKKGSSYNNP